MDLSISGYDIIEKIGEGGMAEVYRARHQRLDRDVALKVLLRRFSHDKSFAERFLREARIAAKLNHANIVQIYDVDKVGDDLFLAMELISGGDLSQRLRASRNKATALRVFKQLCAALDYAHAKGYVHRDIKPANILFRDDGSLALSDFGIARPMDGDTHMTQTGIVVGTPSYMSPEQAQGHELNGRSDLYSVGVMAYQFVTGQLPFKADSSISVAIKHITSPIPRLPEHLDAFQEFFEAALAKDPAQRFPSGHDFAFAFAQCLDNVESFNADDATVVMRHQAQNNKTTLRKPQAEATEFFDEDQHLPAVAANAGFFSLTQETMRIVFMQMNRFFIFVQEPFRKGHFVGIAVLMVLVMALGYLLADSNVFQKQIVLSPAEQVRVGQLLTQADTALAENRLLQPAGNNAYEFYQAILQLSPDDPIALDGLGQIVSKLTIDAEKAIDSEDFTSANAFIAAIESIKHDAEEIDDLREAYNTASQARTERLAEGLREAKRQMKDGDIPAAIRQYEALIGLETEKREASNALSAIAREKLSSGLTQVKNNEFDSARANFDLAKTAAKPLMNSELDEAIRIALAQINRIEGQVLTAQRVVSLLDEAEKAMAVGALDNPYGKNAWYYYSQVLARDAYNRDALAGQRKIREMFVDMAERALAAQDLNNAQNTIDRLTRLDAAHPKLGELNQQLNALKSKLAAEKLNKEKTTALFKRAEKYIEGKRPGGAEKIYRRIESLSPRDPGLPALAQDIADSYVYLAQREIDKGDWRDVYVWVERGLTFVPQHKKLLEQKQLADQKLRR